jgi:hypothetical protein
MRIYAGLSLQKLGLGSQAEAEIAQFLHMLRFGHDRHYLRGGYQFDYDDTDGRNYTYIGHRFMVGAQYTLPWYDIPLGYDFDMQYRNYAGERARNGRAVRSRVHEHRPRGSAAAVVHARPAAAPDR